MARIFGLVLAGGLVLGAASESKAQFALSIGNPYYGGYGYGMGGYGYGMGGFGYPGFAYSSGYAGVAPYGLGYGGYGMPAYGGGFYRGYAYRPFYGGYGYRRGWGGWGGRRWRRW